MGFVSSSLLSPLADGAIKLSHRVVMSPLTRMRARQPGNVPGEMNALYYGQRASAGGLIISEATQISQRGQGYPATPGIHSPEQVKGWRLVTEAVHKKGGLIFLQLWHVGRISHSSHQPDSGPPWAPSPIRPRGKAHTASWEEVPFERPREIELAQIPAVIDEYRNAARNALAAGFDGVELHGANGYLLDQFLRDGTNQRKDAYGGSIDNRSRFLFEVLEAASSVFGSDRVGVRLSPFDTFNDMQDSDPLALFSRVISRLGAQKIAYVHLIEARAHGDQDERQTVWSKPGAAPTAALFRPLFPSVLIGAGGFSYESATQAIDQGTVDAVAFGRFFIANPDLPRRFELRASLNRYDRSTFYGGGAKGYVDYPALTDISDSTKITDAEVCC
ncbi:MAG TPA: alkene reductase [Blastocatellia bacterium]|nr:alkene reductase [Blastocatellia bacterium]